MPSCIPLPHADQKGLPWNTGILWQGSSHMDMQAWRDDARTRLPDDLAKVLQALLGVVPVARDAKHQHGKVALPRTPRNLERSRKRGSKFLT